ncbi:hypothetical protein PUR34_16280 [Streptomyces sp. JV185]|uniref:hypothetical protein n=1 Tax=Streptomyces sp. JV185 TaxID=858638 RepID=UPI002E784895|nr:hypothetical protein [Streptomyces sp. JV185]MEE1769659.1 hypothetical protein [Streptomyces sp. JV185]
MGGSRGEGAVPGGRPVLHRFNGDEEYGLDTAVVRLIRSYDGDADAGVTVWFEARADPDAARRCEDTADMGAAPSAEVGVAMTAAGRTSTGWSGVRS